MNSKAMLRISLFVFLGLGVLFTGAQSCLPDGIVFSNQSQIDNFKADYPGCIEIEGSVIIESWWDIHNLDSLHEVYSIGGNLKIRNCWMLRDLDGLSSLESVGGSLEVENDSLLADVSGLAKLNEVGSSIKFIHNISLTSIDLFHDLDSLNGHLDITGNYILSQLSGFENLVYVGGDIKITGTHITGLSVLDKITEVNGNLEISYNYYLAGMPGLGSIQAIHGNLYIYRNNSLQDLSGLDELREVGGWLHLRENTQMQNLSGLDKLEHVYGYGYAGSIRISGQHAMTNMAGLGSLEDVRYFNIDANEKLHDLAGLFSLDSIERLEIDENPALVSLDGLESLNSATHSIKITGNDSLMDIQGLNGLKLVGDIDIINNPLLENLTGLDGLTEMGDLTIENNNMLGSLAGIESLTALSGTFKVKDNPSLHTLEDLNIQTLGGLEISNNDLLPDLSGLDSLHYVSDRLSISYNELLTDLDALENLTHSGSLTILANPSLLDLSGLGSLTALDGNLKVEFNGRLESLSGLDSIDAASIHNLTLTYNEELWDCAVQSICDYLADPGGWSSIYGNEFYGCRSVEIVQDNCDDPSYVCMPAGATFSTQSEIDSFPILYPVCTEIDGIVVIEGDDITNLDGLGQVETFRWNVFIRNTPALESLEGLENIRWVKSKLHIENTGIRDLSGLGYLERIDNSLNLVNNVHLKNLDGLASKLSIGNGLNLQYNDSLTDITGLEMVDTLSHFSLIGNARLRQLDGLESLKYVGSALELSDNASLTDLSALGGLEFVGWQLMITGNDSLISLNGLGNADISHIEYLYIDQNPMLSECEVNSICEYLLDPGAYDVIEYNDTGCNSIAEVQEKCAYFIEEGWLQGLKVYPNPARDILFINAASDYPLDEAVVYNYLGQEMLRKTEPEGMIRISSLKPGIYMLVIRSGNEKARFRFVRE